MKKCVEVGKTPLYMGCGGLATATYSAPVGIRTLNLLIRSLNLERLQCICGGYLPIIPTYMVG